MARVVVIGNYANSFITSRKEILAELIENGHEVFVCAPLISQDIKAKIIENGIIPVDIPFERVGINPIKDINGIIKLYRFFKKLKPDVVLSYTVKPIVYGSICGKLTKVQTISSIITGLGYSFIGNDFKIKIIRGIVKLLYKIALQFNKIVFFQNPDDLNLFLEFKIVNKEVRKTIINGSGVDTKHFTPEKFPNQISFLMISRLLKDKGVMEYFRAASTIKNKYPSVKFYLVGPIDKNPSSIKKEDLETLIHEKTIEYLGKLKDVRPAIANSSVYVLPSYREGTPRTVLEAMAMGRPIITTDAPGCRETVSEAINGFLIPIKNAAALAEAMEKFILHSSLIPQMGVESRKIAEEKYEITKVNKVIMRDLGLIGGREDSLAKF